MLSKHVCLKKGYGILRDFLAIQMAKPLLYVTLGVREGWMKKLNLVTLRITVLGDPNFIWGAAKLGHPKPTLVTTWSTCQALS